MATIRKRGGSYQVQIRRDGHPPISKSFRSKADALSWARETERVIEKGEKAAHKHNASVTVGDLLRRYEQTVTPSKRGARFEKSRIATLLAHPMSQTTLAELTPATVARYRDDRLNAVCGASVRRELSILRHCLTLAKREWDAPLTANPVLSIKLPAPSRARDQRLEPETDHQLHAALLDGRTWYLRPLIGLAIETGMRRGELLSLRWIDVNFKKRTGYLPLTKNGRARTVPLTPKAIEIILTLPRTGERVFPISSNCVRLAWTRLRERAGIKDYRFHDLRHEAISRFFEYGLSVPEVATISGHRDYRQLERYVHLRPQDIAEKLARLTPKD